MRQIIAFCLLFILVYNPPLSFIPINLTYIVYIIGLLHFIFIRKFYISKSETTIFICFLATVIWGSFITIINGAYDFNMLGISRFLTGILSSMAIVYCLRYNNTYRPIYFSILEFIVIAACIQGVIVLITFVCEPAKSLLLNMLSNMPSSELTKIINLSIMRGIGWTYVQFADFAVIQGFGLFSLIAIKFLNIKTDVKKYFGAILFLLIISGVLIARTFLILLLGASIFYMYLQLIIHKKTFKLLLIFKIISICAILILIIYQFALQLLSEDTFNWIFEAYNNFDASGKFQTDSTDELKQYWHFPSNVKTILLGDGRFIDQIKFNYAQSDSAYIIGLFYWGIIGNIIYYTFIFALYYRTRLLCNNKVMRALIVVFFLTILLYNIKGIFSGLVYFCVFLESLIVHKEINRKY